MAQLFEVRERGKTVGSFSSDQIRLRKRSQLVLAVCLACGLNPTATNGDDASGPIAEFFRMRDEWLYRQALDELAPFDRKTMQRPIKEQRDAKQAAIADFESTLAPLLERIKKNKGKQFMEKIVAKNESEAAGIQNKIAKLRADIDGLADGLEREEKQLAALNAKEDTREAEHKRALPERAKQLAVSRRADFGQMPAVDPLAPEKFAAGMIGTIPQWPVVIPPDLNRLRRGALENCCKMIVGGQELTEYHWRLVDECLSGGRVLAKKQHNIRVIQVFDKQRMLVAFTAGAELLDWPLFLLDVGSTADYADDTTYRIKGIGVVTGTHRYQAVSGAARTVFVVKLLGASNLPPAYAGPMPAKATEAPAGDGIDLLAVIEPKRDARSGQWVKDANGLLSPPTEGASLEIPFALPGEYVLTAVVERIKGTDAFAIELIAGDSAPWVIMDGWSGTISGLHGVDGKEANANETTVRQQAPLLDAAHPHTVRCAVAGGHVTVQCDGKAIVDWRGDSSRLPQVANFEPGRTKLLRLRSHLTQWRISAVRIATNSAIGAADEPLSGAVETAPSRAERK